MITRKKLYLSKSKPPLEEKKEVKLLNSSKNHFDKLNNKPYARNLKVVKSNETERIKPKTIDKSGRDLIMNIFILKIMNNNLKSVDFKEVAENIRVICYEHYYLVYPYEEIYNLLLDKTFQQNAYAELSRMAMGF